MSTLTLEGAITYAVQAHAGQVDKAGVAYIMHLLRVMMAVPPDLRIAAVLHDVLEDTDAWLPDGITERDAMLVRMLSHVSPTETFMDYIRRVATCPQAVTIKLADIADNSDLSRFSPGQEEMREQVAGMVRTRYAKAKAILEKGRTQT